MKRRASRHPIRWVVTGVLLAQMAGCAVGPDFQAPQAALPARWDAAGTAAGGAAPDAARTAISDAAPDAQWWRAFNDPTLDALLNRVAGANLDVQAAAARLSQARAALRVADANRLPEVGADTSYRHARASSNGLSDASGRAGKADYDLWQGGFDAAWEIDLWGRVRRQAEVAGAAAQASAELQRDVLLAALADTAQAYMSLRGVQAERAIVAQNLDIARHSQALTQRRYDDGVATGVDVAEAAAQVSTIEARLPDLDNRADRLVNALSRLLALPPAALAGELRSAAPIPAPPAVARVGLPAELARRRPDIRAAEARLHQATANIGVAVADFYPRITLSGDAGLQALQFNDLGDWGSRIFGIGPVLHVPLFDGGRLRGQLALSQARQQEAMIDYQRVVLRAWHEVADALGDYGALQRQHEKLGAAVAQNQTALEQARRQYVAGAADFLNVLALQKDLLATQQALARSDTGMDLAIVRLFKALGGGWESSFPLAAANADGDNS
ncbi:MULTISPECIES: efflux transporter outer membrane subunit [unclassified Achromobacter]|uniref:efflux transporter outer membrane subunit n=1 Tax=unclassified Achromobacter TaxID=2626865 RepID=UPI000B517167|nr:MULTISPECIES: efflux transporter outer membrane subunit [unclassified Achromobacter]OWT80727.1 RND transporter [Achromobacter sp. HZ34]OWT81243.1 RND transporter [Achromobacter sp. HZ28]